MDDLYLVDFGVYYKLISICYDGEKGEFRFVDLSTNDIRFAGFKSLEEAKKRLEELHKCGAIKKYYKIPNDQIADIPIQIE